MIVYDFNVSDLEDNLPREKGLLTPPDRRSILIALAFGLVMIVGMLTLLRALLDSRAALTALLALLLVSLCPRMLGNFGARVSDLPDALYQFIVRPLVSMGAGITAMLLLFFGSRTRLQPLRTPVRTFCFAFIALMSIDILFGEQLGLMKPVNTRWWSLFGESTFGLLFESILVLVAWSATHMFFIIVFSTILTIAEILLERLFRPRISGAAEQPPCIHLSDLHVTAAGAQPIQEHRLSAKELLEALRSTVATATAPIALTGDITDAGTREEWRLAIAAIESGRIDGARTVPVLLVPGNHDLFPYMDEFAPTRSALGLGSRLVPLRKLRYLEAAARLCPQLQVGNESGTLLSDRLGRNAKLLKDFAAGDHSETKLVNDLWDSCFPLHCVIGLQAFIILDTNRPAMSFITAAFGEIATPVWRRLDALLTRLNSRKELQIVVLGHHHLYTPLEKRNLWLVKWLEIVSRHDLLKLLSHSADFYLHGHRHVAFNFKFNRLNVFASASMRS